MKLNNICVGTGLVALDLIYGEKNSVQVGGTCGNILLILAKLGWEVYPSFNAANNMAYNFMKKEFSLWGVNSDYILYSQASVPIIIQQNHVLKSGTIKHQFKFICPKCKKLLPRYTSIDYEDMQSIIKNSKIPKVFFFDRVNKSSIAMAEFYKKRGSIIYFEPSSKGRKKQFDLAVKLSDIVKYSSDQLQDIELPQASTNLIIETLGDQGLRFKYKQSNWVNIDGFKVDNIKDTSGCGDWFSAIFIHKFLYSNEFTFDNINIEVLGTIMKKAQSFSALNCLYEGARGMMYALTIEQLEELSQKLQSGDSVQASISYFSDKAILEADPDSFLCTGCNKI